MGRRWLCIGLVVVAACGEVKQDTDAARGDGAIPIDASGDGGVDAGCGYACWAPDLGGLSPRGATECGAAVQCNSAFDWIEAIDVCTCSVAFNEALLFVVPEMGTGRARIAALVPDVIPLSLSLTDTFGVCYGGGPACGFNSCPAGQDLLVGWNGIPVAPGVNTFTLYGDDGSGCTAELYQFVIDLQTL